MLLNRRVSFRVIACITLLSFTFLSSKLFAQVAEGINYQAVARDANNNVLANTQITIQFSIVANSATGTTVYQELHDDTPTSSLLQTNDFGLFNLVIGRGVRNGGTLNAFEEIDWSLGRYFLRVEIAVGSNSLETLGTTELVSVPFALYAKSSGNAIKAGIGIQVVGKDSVINTGDLSESNELISSFSILPGNVLRITEAATNYDVDLTPLLPASTDSQSLSFSSNGDSILIENGNGIDIKFITDTIVSFNNRITTNQTSSATNANSITANQNDITNINSNVNTLLTNFRFDSIQTEQNQDSIVILTALIGNGSDDQNLSFSPTRDSILIENGSGIRIQFILDTVANLRSGISNNSTAISVNAADITTNQNDITNLNTNVNTLQSNFTSDSTQTLQNRDSIGILTTLVGSVTDDQNLSFSQTRDSILIENGSGIRIQFILDTVANLRSGISNNSTRISVNSAAIITNQNDITNLNTNVNTLQSNFTSDSTQTQQNQDSIAVLTTLLGSDYDADSTNELIDSIRFNNRVLEIYQQGIAQTISFDTLYDSRRLTLFNRTISNRDSIDAVVSIINGITNNDNDSTNEIQQLSLIGDVLRINDPSGLTNPAPIDLSVYNTTDNLGDHQLDSNLRLGAFYVSGDGGNEGLLIGGDGNSSFSSGVSINSNQTTAAYPLSIRAASSRVLEIKDAVTNAVEWDINFVAGNLEFNETGVGAPFTLSTNNRVGIATTTPDSTLTVNGGIKSTYFTMTDGAASGRVLTSDANGVATWQLGSTDDQLLSISGTNGTITLEDGGSIQVADSSASNEIQQLTLLGSQLSINDPSGTINPAPIDLSTLNISDNLGNHRLDSNLRLGGFYISDDGDDEGLSVNTFGEVTVSSITGPSLTIAKESESSLMEFFSYGSGSAAGSIFDLYNHRGSFTTPLSVQDGDGLFTIRSRAFDGSGVAFNELMTMNVDGVVSSGVVPTRTDFNVAKGDGVTSTVMTLRSSGNVGIGELIPDSVLTVNGGIKSTYFTMTDGAFNGWVLTSDANGVATWQPASASSSGGVFEKVGGVLIRDTTSDYSSDFVIGSPQLNDDGIATHDNRMFFDKSLGAFRAGGVNGIDWDLDSLGLFSTAFGENTRASGDNSTVSGGRFNTAINVTSTVGGGRNNAAGGSSSTVGGGQDNAASGNNSAVGGGRNNNASGENSTVAGGQANIATSFTATVAGGNSNNATGTASTIGGGQLNTANNLFSTIAGGNSNSASGSVSTVGGGQRDTASGFASTIGGGISNTASGTNSSISGGESNSVVGSWSSIIGGLRNTASGNYSTIGGGQTNNATGVNSVIAGGFTNVASGGQSVVAGGNSNTASGDYSMIGGGNSNTASSSITTIGGGQTNTASGFLSTIGGGNSNNAVGFVSTISGGQTNSTTGFSSTIGGGQSNTASGFASTIAGGETNKTFGTHSAVGGGNGNTTNGAYSAIVGGLGNTAQSYNEIALGIYNDTLVGGFSSAVYNLTDRLLIIGNGTAINARSNALVMLKNGNTKLNGELTLSNGSSSFTLPNADGTAGQILQTNGAGAVTWTSLNAATTCPTGMTNVNGNICIETNERAASDWYDAAETCTSLGYKLPTWSEWYGAATNAVLTNETNNWEWVSDGTSNTARKVGNTNLKNTANDDPETGSANFRCIFYK